jgi:hypothetical protein
MNSYIVKIPVFGSLEFQVEDALEADAVKKAMYKASEYVRGIKSGSGAKLTEFNYGDNKQGTYVTSKRIDPDVICFHCSSSDFKKVTTYEQNVQFTNGKFIEHDKQEAFIYQCATCGAILNKENAAKLSKLLKG